MIFFRHCTNTTGSFCMLFQRASIKVFCERFPRFYRISTVAVCVNQNMYRVQHRKMLLEGISHLSRADAVGSITKWSVWSIILFLFSAIVQGVGCILARQIRGVTKTNLSQHQTKQTGRLAPKQICPLQKLRPLQGSYATKRPVSAWKSRHYDFLQDRWTWFL